MPKRYYTTAVILRVACKKRNSGFDQNLHKACRKNALAHRKFSYKGKDVIGVAADDLARWLLIEPKAYDWFVKALDLAADLVTTGGTKKGISSSDNQKHVDEVIGNGVVRATRDQR